MPIRNRPGNQIARQEGAQERQTNREQRSVQQQWDKLDEKLGKNRGAEKERARLVKEAYNGKA